MDRRSRMAIRHGRPRSNQQHPKVTTTDPSGPTRVETDALPDALPQGLVAMLDGEDLAMVQAWWRQLPRQAQRELALSWDMQAASCRFSLIDEAPLPRWEEVPIVVGAHFLPDEDPDDPDDWNVDFYEYLVNNPELGIHFNGRTFHICRAHPVARVLLRAGVIPGGFRCPQAGPSCPMEELQRLQPGTRVVLRGRRIPKLVTSLPEQALDHLSDALDDAGHADAE